MSIQNVGNNSNVPEYKTPDDINLKPADVYDSQKIGNTLAGIENSVQRDLDNALQDGVIDNNERNTLKAWLGQVKTLSKSIANIVSKTYEGYRDRLDVVKKDIEDHLGIEDTVQEPSETDAQQKNRYAHLNKQADKLLQASLDEDQARINADMSHAFNPGYKNRKPRPSMKTLENIRDLYMSTISVDGKRQRCFTDSDKVNSLVTWAKRQLSAEKIGQDDYAILVEGTSINTNYNAVQSSWEEPQSQGSGFWQEYADVMHQEGHSHNGTDDLAVLGYSEEEAQAVLNSDQEEPKAKRNLKSIERRFD